MRIEPQIARGEPLKDAVKLYPETDREVCDLARLHSKANPKACNMLFTDEDELVYLYIPLSEMLRVSLLT